MATCKQCMYVCIYVSINSFWLHRTEIFIETCLSLVLLIFFCNIFVSNEVIEY